MRRLKTWGGAIVTQAGQARVIVTATSQREAIKLLDRAGWYMSLYEFRGYWTETGNAIELSVARTRPGVWGSMALEGLGGSADSYVEFLLKPEESK